ncbi:hypothetical protein F0562_003291 [Nyssa sinensis]|uniref:NB-ARC domain-containing protein n=1 Tax=Nyssa sinensis TaxID=561372 RepID=A0A5J5BZ00_9ASTE|nr:hypothetical protein F0562_003291 [Nyssa sinensis]
MVEFIVLLAVARISDLLVQQSVFLHGVTDEVEHLQAELKRMLCFLKDGRHGSLRRFTSIFSTGSGLSESKLETFLRVCKIMVKSIGEGEGIGSISKTTLAKKVYNHNDVKHHFECYAWAFIPQQCEVRDVLLVIQIKLSSPSMEERKLLDRLKEEELVQKLYDFLRTKRYLVVLDDIGRNEAWDSLKVAFPNGKMGSKILFTTRNKEVALYADPWSFPIEPPFLSDDESWELLCKKAFRRDIVGNHNFPPQFEKLGREMVRKCGGLPLALVVLGRLLATKKSLNEWEAVQRNINVQLNRFQEHKKGVYSVLALSYHELPYYLKPCFLYLGHFPEDWEIQKKQLI